MLRLSELFGSSDLGGRHGARPRADDRRPAVPEARSTAAATQLALVLYTAYNLAATLISIPAGRAGDRFGTTRMLAAGAALFLLAYSGLAATGASFPRRLLIAAGLGIGCAETAEHAAVAHLAPEGIRGSAFGLLSALQSAGNLAASAIAGALWTLISPAAAFIYAAAWMALALAGLLLTDRSEERM